MSELNLKRNTHTRTKKLLLLLICILLINITACESQQDGITQEDHNSINKINDSLSATGKHGYYTFYFIVGRLKTSLVDGTPFNVAFTKINKELLDKTIKFKLLDADHYQISYSLNNKETSYVGLFDKKYENDYESVLVTKSDYLKPNDNSFEASQNVGRKINNLKNNSYIIQVHKY